MAEYAFARSSFVKFMVGKLGEVSATTLPRQLYKLDSTGHCLYALHQRKVSPAITSTRATPLDGQTAEQMCIHACWGTNVTRIIRAHALAALLGQTLSSCGGCGRRRRGVKWTGALPRFTTATKQ
jgi:hypothetical protein